MTRTRPAAILGGVLLVLLAAALSARACPVCDTGTGRAVRAGVFGADFGRNLLVTALPFPIFLGITALLYYGPPSVRRRGGDDTERKT